MPIILSSTVDAVQATINWIVTATAYTPERYFIVYGLRNDTLDLRSNPVEGATNLTTTNMAYSVTITGLRPFTQYYYRINARNSFTTTESATEMFQTTEGGMSLYQQCVISLIIVFYCTLYSTHSSTRLLLSDKYRVQKCYTLLGSTQRRWKKWHYHIIYD